MENNSYASSSFCLDQLSYFLSLPPTRRRRRSIFPASCDLEPSHFRWQKGPLMGAFKDEKKKNGFDEETVHKWRNALREVTVLFGWDMKNYRYNQLSWIF
ncbi:toll/interleukin-1 receptor-like protein [Amborella trichopoda]|uniref:toll/interleukin-1 receptor-like protein n=1 Tax=Amborella trichopoda TaxID=13333 RepID=UPI0009BE0930|nr:toll/interleukin-1 receptor-like protein [Amborella trichopoda]|eukprot:XP_020530074.1 toll/interleukin-1 receptor-like protein [Amborella trichopoda]